MYCKHCGQNIDDDSTFCAKCGKPISGTSKASPGRTTPNDVTQKNPSPSSQNTAPKNKNTLNLALTIICALPLIVAEYRRLVLVGTLDVFYWLLVLPIVLSAYFLYCTIGAPEVAKHKRLYEEALNRGEDYNIPKGSFSAMTSEYVSTCLFILAIYAFAVSGIMQLIF